MSAAPNFRGGRFETQGNSRFMVQNPSEIRAILHYGPRPPFERDGRGLCWSHGPVPQPCRSVVNIMVRKHASLAHRHKLSFSYGAPDNENHGENHEDRRDQ